ncbi:hypothetical protein M0R04_06970 [Candidatus Dojkabacteria bacterium]|jgi:hypothetical protein|nr:hypothetical protein [Candidatus Dojkabacteria bacterium]
MCNDKLLEELKHLQVKPKKLCCTASSTCWCGQVSYKFGHSVVFEGCMSPAEMLEVAGSDMNAQDIQYLKKLSTYDFDHTEP